VGFFIAVDWLAFRPSSLNIHLPAWAANNVRSDLALSPLETLLLCRASPALGIARMPHQRVFQCSSPLGRDHLAL